MDVIHYQIKQQILAHGREWTRENFILYNWGGEYPGVWDESDIPEDLQDWDALPPT